MPPSAPSTAWPPSSALADWIDHNVAFPNCIVYRITPVTGNLECERVRMLTGIDEKMPVVSEKHAQWVVEDNVPMGRPAIYKVGVEFFDDVVPLEDAADGIARGEECCDADSLALDEAYVKAERPAGPLMVRAQKGGGRGATEAASGASTGGGANGGGAVRRVGRGAVAGRGEGAGDGRGGDARRDGAWSRRARAFRRLGGARRRGLAPLARRSRNRSDDGDGKDVDGCGRAVGRRAGRGICRGSGCTRK